jgi:hypothetical protein
VNGESTRTHEQLLRDLAAAAGDKSETES